MNTQSPGECDISLNADQMHEAAGPSLFPNPSTSYSPCNCPTAWPHHRGLDATGRRMLSERTGDANVRIGTEALPSGAYFVRVTDALGSVGRSTWMKE
ncbi:MAG: hypothetical protein IPL52_17780 [Flavobacteriales bacterium]|nr:hypothetical protein [Flavobacteriales bacterium]